MYNETRRAVRRAFDIGKVIFSLSEEDFENLVDATNKIPPPTKEQLHSLMSKDISFEDAVGVWLRKAYAQAAFGIGLKEEHGLAMLAYAALLKELEE